jgi:hypothetical protein
VLAPVSSLRCGPRRAVPFWSALTRVWGLPVTIEEQSS